MASIAERIHVLLTGDDEIRTCKDIPDSACREEPGNFVRHLGGAVGNKIADELSNARLILPWLFGAMGAPAWMIGWIVPIREAGALLPQLFMGAALRALPIRKKAWALGGVLQAVGALGLAALALAGALVSRRLQPVE